MESIVDLIYETVADPEIWNDVTRRIGEKVDAPSRWIFRPREGNPAFLVLDGIPDNFLDAYARHYHAVDPLVGEWRRRQHRLSGALRDRDFISEQQWLSSEIYNDLCVGTGIAQLLTLILKDSVEPSPPVISFFRPHDAPLFSSKDVQTLQALAPHLRRAIRLRDLVDGAQYAADGWNGRLLDQMPAGIFLLDGRGRVLHANAAGRSILDRRDGLALKDGRLGATLQASTGALQAALAACLSSFPQGRQLRVARRDGEWLVSTCPLLSSPARVVGEERCRAWVWVSDPRETSDRLADQLSVLYGVTAAEQRVAVALAAGCSAAQISEQARVSLPTVRTQIQSIFGKLGVRRQSDLVRLLATLSHAPRP